MEYVYLQRRAERRAYAGLKREIVFGMVIATMMLAAGLWRYFVVIGASDAVAESLAVIGGCGLVLAVVFPAAWIPLEKALSRVMTRVGSGLFAVLLTLVYVVMITPVGWLLRRTKGTGPIHRWERKVPDGLPGWTGKEVTVEANLGRSGKAGLLRRWVAVLQFFIDRGHYIFLPALVLLIALGLVLFFVKTSALAPLIYTLF